MNRQPPPRKEGGKEEEEHSCNVLPWLARPSRSLLASQLIAPVVGSLRE